MVGLGEKGARDAWLGSRMERIDGRQVGERLRAIRRQKGLSLHDVEARSDQEFKASVLGAYERGERAISVPRLLRLAELYRVPPDQLLPAARTTSRSTSPSPIGALGDGFTIDLVRLHEIDDDDAAVIARYAATIQLQRQDFNGQMLTIRSDDLRVLAAVMGRSPEDLGSRLDELGLRGGLAPDRPPVRVRHAQRPTAYRRRYVAGYARPDVPAPSPTQVKILVPGNHLMVGLLGQRDELLRLVQDAFPVDDPRARATRSPSAATRSRPSGSVGSSRRWSRCSRRATCSTARASAGASRC